jgi:hypothetical protein
MNILPGPQPCVQSRPMFRFAELKIAPPPRGSPERQQDETRRTTHPRPFRFHGRNIGVRGGSLHCSYKYILARFFSPDMAIPSAGRGSTNRTGKGFFIPVKQS